MIPDLVFRRQGPCPLIAYQPPMEPAPCVLWRVEGEGRRKGHVVGAQYHYEILRTDQLPGTGHEITRAMAAFELRRLRWYGGTLTVEVPGSRPIHYRTR